MSEPTAAFVDHRREDGVIHDIGYQNYDGVRLGRRQIVRALYWHSLRAAFGFGRSAKAKILPILLFVIMCAPAIVNAVVVAVNKDQSRLVSYDTYTYQLRLFVMTIFVAAQAPELVSRDLRNHVLPLYFSRPVRRSDYPMAKLAAFFTANLAMVGIPLIILYAGTVASAHGGSAVWHETKALIPGLGVALMYGVVLTVIGLLIASFSGRRAYTTGAIAVFFFLTWSVSNVLISVSGYQPGNPDAATTGGKLAGLLSPFSLIDGVRRWLGGLKGEVPDPGSLGAVYGLVVVALVAACVAGLLLRYRKVGVA